MTKIDNNSLNAKPIEINDNKKNVTGKEQSYLLNQPIVDEVNITSKETPKKKNKALKWVLGALGALFVVAVAVKIHNKKELKKLNEESYQRGRELYEKSLKQEKELNNRSKQLDKEVEDLRQKVKEAKESAERVKQEARKAQERAENAKKNAEKAKQEANEYSEKQKSEQRKSEEKIKSEKVIKENFAVNIFKICGFDFSNLDDLTPEKLKKAYRHIAKEIHPDKNPNNEKAKELFQTLNEANEILSRRFSEK